MPWSDEELDELQAALYERLKQRRLEAWNAKMEARAAANEALIRQADAEAAYKAENARFRGFLGA